MAPGSRSPGERSPGPGPKDCDRTEPTRYPDPAVKWGTGARRPGPEATIDTQDEPTESTARDGWALIGRQLLAQRWGLLAGVVAGLCWTAAKVSVPKLVELAIDQGIEPGDRHQISRYAWLIAGAAVVCAFFTGLRRYSAFREARFAEAVLRDRLFAHLARLHFAYHDGQQTGQLMSRANNDLQQIQNAVVLVPLTIANLATVLAVLVVLLTIDPILTVLALGSLPAVNYLAKRFSQKLHPTMVGVQQESAELSAVVEETVAGIRVVKGFAAEDTQRRRLGKEADDLYEVSMDGARIRSTYWPALELLPNIGLIMVLGYGGHQVIEGHLALGSLVAFNAYVVLLVWPLRMLGWIVAMSQRAAASAQRVHEVLVTDPEVVSPAHPQQLPATGGAVSFAGVRFGYSTGAPPVLEGFDLEVPAGQTIALVGATASGKSTVAKLLPRFYDIDAGSIRLDGVDVGALSLPDLRRAVGLVFEETFLFSDTIAANIAFADPDAPADAIVRAARLAGAHQFISELPHGYDTEIGERGFSLSGGQRQRIAIARAILADPRVLILDDATSAVDPTKEHEIRDALTEVMRDRTTIVIAHRPATIALAERVVLVGGGRIIADGTHIGLLASSAEYREVLASAAAREEQARHATLTGDGGAPTPAAADLTEAAP
ncbi:ABC transporter ATP-binding protein/permease [Aquihabitans sp. G128]|uniref:ABC transporter ATP-binding protein n=1 Tax=Aquihabitans sp. G128 TaxID=2849779 RepID=UPI001C21AD73|nr:ABC transporter ATP-binding protein [Aquihabitans sp. G128]QXC61204.1 ABC transporter ATP-binding protein/permease [Aquihabitans sp. G128]